MYKNVVSRPIHILALCVMVSFLSPHIKIGGFGMKPDILFLFPLLLLVFVADRQVKYMGTFRKLAIVTALLFVNMLLSDSLGIYNFNQQSSFYFPTEFLQVFSRMAAFYTFYYIGYHRLITIDRFYIYCNVLFLSALIFGVFQTFDFALIDKISSYYALTDTQISGFESVKQRGFGVAGNILTWGGLSGFIFYYFYYLCENKLLKLAGCTLAIINVSISVSRTAIISLIVSFVLISFIIALLIKRNVASFLKIAIGVTVICVITFYAFVHFFPERYSLILMRFSYMEEALYEGGRGAQRSFFIDFLNKDHWNYFIGIGKPILDSLGYMEMEPFFLLAAYGIVGLVLHYRFLYLGVSNVFKVKNESTRLFGFIIGATIFYLIFSIGFFFMREAYSGLIYWMLIGYFLGNILNTKR